MIEIIKDFVGIIIRFVLSVAIMVVVVVFTKSVALTKSVLLTVWRWIPQEYRHRISSIFTLIRLRVNSSWNLCCRFCNASWNVCCIIWNLCCRIWNWFFGVPNDRKPRGLRNITDDPKPRGLYNLGNTCYFNSVMQSLCKTDVFYNVLQNTQPPGELTHSFRSLMEEMEKKGTGPFDPTKVRNDFVKNVSRFDNRGQHDGHECLRHFLDEIRKEERNTMAGNSGKSSLTTVDKVFGGHLVTVYVCKECLKHYHLFEPCLDVSLPVFFDMEWDESKGSEIEAINRGDKRHDDKEDNYKRSVRKLIEPLADSSAKDYYTGSMIKKIFNWFSYSKKAITLDDCFRHFSRVEQIKGEYLCEDCLGKAMARGEADEDNLKLTSGTKQSLIFNPPAILTIHFKRFELLPGRSKKRSDMVKYPKYLDIAPYCSSHCLRNDPPRNNIWYSLYAVAVHSGSLESGHYVAYVKAREGEENVRGLGRFLQHVYFNHNVTSDELIKMTNEEKQEVSKDIKKPKRKEASTWFLMNDSSVHEVNEEEALSQEAYLLFYERIDWETDNDAQNVADSISL